MSSQTVFRFTSRDGIDGLQEFQEPIPILAEDEVLVKVRSVALNFRDVAIASSAYTLPVKDRVVPCSDMAGEVVRIGGLVSSISLGDHVIAPMSPSQLSGRVTDATDTFGALRDGMLREYVALSANVVIKLPKSPRSLAQWAALVCTGSTVWNSFYGSTALKPGETVLFLGSGGVSLTGLAFAKAGGATTIVTSSSDAKLEYVREKLGADFTINYETCPNWAAEVQRITNGRGVDHVLEVGGLRTIGQSIESVAFGGIVSVIGFVAGAAGAPLGEVPDVAMLALAKACTIRGVLGGTREHLEEAVRLVGSREVSIPVDKTFSFDRDGILAALTYLSAGNHIGKVCINLD